LDFTCNICGARNSGVEDFGREVPSCVACQSSVRLRSFLYALSLELFGVPLILPDFPVLKGLRGLGLTDRDCYAQHLIRCFDYRNTYYDAEPRLDIATEDGYPEGTLDFITSSEVFEHVQPPLVAALKNAHRMLGPRGVLVFTTPWGLDEGPASMEHFPALDDFGLAQLRSGPVLVNRTAEGRLQLFENLIFHIGLTPALEMRRVTAKEIRRMFAEAGFSELRFYTDEYPPFGIRHPEPWSLPLAARKQPNHFDQNVRAELMAQFGELRNVVRRMADAIDQRTAWAQSLETELLAERQRLKELDAEFVSRTEWARSLDKELEQVSALAASLQQQLESRTAWAQDLDRQLQERTKWALDSDEQLNRLKTELGLLRAGSWNRLGRLLRFVR